jgi:hypothetical protein
MRAGLRSLEQVQCGDDREQGEQPPVVQHLVGHGEGGERHARARQRGRDRNHRVQPW